MSFFVLGSSSVAGSPWYHYRLTLFSLSCSYWHSVWHSMYGTTCFDEILQVQQLHDLWNYRTFCRTTWQPWHWPYQDTMRHSWCQDSTFLDHHGWGPWIWNNGTRRDEVAALSQFVHGNSKKVKFDHERTWKAKGHSHEVCGETAVLLLWDGQQWLREDPPRSWWQGQAATVSQRWQQFDDWLQRLFILFSLVRLLAF